MRFDVQETMANHLPSAFISMVGVLLSILLVTTLVKSSSRLSLAMSTTLLSR